MKKIDICKTSIEPNRNVLWLDNGHLKYYSPNGWENIQSETKYVHVQSTLGDIEVEVELPIATDTQVGGVRVMDADQTHLLVSREGNLYVDTTDNYMDTNPHKIPTMAAITGLWMDTHGEKEYATEENYGIVKQAKKVSTTTTESAGAINTKLNNLIIALQDAGIMAK